MKLRLPAWPALVAAALVLAIDQASKLIIVHLRDRLPYFLFGDVRLEYVQNTGASFSLFRGHSSPLIGVVGVITAAVVIGLFTAPRRYGVPLGLILGGSLGNLIDRIRLGYAVDFIGVYSWPTFNVSDIALVAGIGVLALVILWPRRGAA
jgi:signal peptidase II